jgi:hypothetical protein
MNNEHSDTNPLAASLRDHARRSVDALRQQFGGVGTLSPQQCVRVILAYALFLQHLDRLFQIIKEAAGSTNAMQKIETVRQIELGWTGDGTSHAELFARAAAPFYEDQIHISEEPDKVPTDAEGMRERAMHAMEATPEDVLTRSYWRNIEMVLRSAMNKPAIGFVAYYFVYLAYTKVLKQYLAELFEQSGYDSTQLAYFAANTPEDLEQCLNLLMDGFLSEVAHPGNTFEDVSIPRVINVTEQFIKNIFLNAPTAAYGAAATQSLAHTAVA